MLYKLNWATQGVGPCNAMLTFFAKFTLLFVKHIIKISGIFLEAKYRPHLDGVCRFGLRLGKDEWMILRLLTSRVNHIITCHPPALRWPHRISCLLGQVECGHPCDLTWNQFGVLSQRPKVKLDTLTLDQSYSSN